MSEMVTTIIQIGNSDDKLTQKRWSEFVGAIDLEVECYAEQIHFASASNGASPWQNFAWVFEMECKWVEEMTPRLQTIRKDFDQDSLALTIGETKFI